MNNSDERDYAEESANRAAMLDEVSMPATGGWLSGACDPPPAEPGSTRHAVRRALLDTATRDSLELARRLKLAQSIEVTEQWTDEDRRFFTNWMCGYSPDAVLTFELTRRGVAYPDRQIRA